MGCRAPCVIAHQAGTTASVMRSSREIVRRQGFFRDQFVAEQAGFFPRRLGCEAPQQDQQRLGGLPVGGAMGQHAFHHRAPQSGRAAKRVDKSGFMTDLERRPERGEGRFRQAQALYVLLAIAIRVIGWYIASDGIAA